VREELSRGWRRAQQEEAAAAAAASRSDSGAPQGGKPQVDGGGNLEGAFSGSDGGGGGGSGSGSDGQRQQRRVYMTLTEMKRRQLLAAGAKSYAQWADYKARDDALRARERRRAARADRRAKLEAVVERGERAVELCEKEHAWPSRIVEPYPRGTFGSPPRAQR